MDALNPTNSLPLKSQRGGEKRVMNSFPYNGLREGGNDKEADIYFY